MSSELVIDDVLCGHCCDAIVQVQYVAMCLPYFGTNPCDLTALVLGHARDKQIAPQYNLGSAGLPQKQIACDA